MKKKIVQMMFAALVCAGAQAQVNSGSNGSDGVFNPTMSTVINMAAHPNGIYQYTSVNISNGVTVTFIPNAANSPVTWLVQSNVVINGKVDVSGQRCYNTDQGATGGPGGYAGGQGGQFATAGQGPGGGTGLSGNGPGSYATGHSPYGNTFLIPLLGGSGGAGTTNLPNGSSGGGGGGGAILIAASGQINLNGTINAYGGSASFTYGVSGGVTTSGGSGGGIRLVATQFSGSGNINASGNIDDIGFGNNGGQGRIRVDSYVNTFSGAMSGSNTLGSQFVIIPVAGQGVQLTVTSVGGVSVSASPTGILTTPDAVLSAQQDNPIPVVVSCVNLPLNTLITVSVKPANGAAVSATGYNNTGTLAASTATIPIVMPRGGGLIYATATTSN